MIMLARGLDLPLTCALLFLVLALVVGIILLLEARAMERQTAELRQLVDEGRAWLARLHPPRAP